MLDMNVRYDLTSLIYCPISAIQYEKNPSDVLISNIRNYATNLDSWSTSVTTRPKSSSKCAFNSALLNLTSFVELKPIDIVHLHRSIHFKTPRPCSSLQQKSNAIQLQPKLVVKPIQLKFTKIWYNFEFAHEPWTASNFYHATPL